MNQISIEFTSLARRTDPSTSVIAGRKLEAFDTTATDEATKAMLKAMAGECANV